VVHPACELTESVGNERKYLGALSNNDETDYRRSCGCGVSESERSRRPGALVDVRPSRIGSQYPVGVRVEKFRAEGRTARSV
jgi:hypothetical protein